MIGYQNPNCDGSHCVRPGLVRVLPTGGDSNGILCYHCFVHEIGWRRDRNKTLEESAQFPLPEWQSLRVYNPEES